MNARHISYWLATGIFCAMLGFSGIGHSLRAEFLVESMTALGYPVYFMTIIGVFKLAGVVTLLAPGLPLLKEWAYAGFAFNLIGATASHVFAGDPLSHAIRPAIVLGVGVASYLLRPASRRLPQSFGVASGGSSEVGELQGGAHS
jgi:hypothetical protein